MKIKIIKTIELPNDTYIEGDIFNTEHCIPEMRHKYINLYKTLIESMYAIEIKENNFKASIQKLPCHMCDAYDTTICLSCKFSDVLDKDSMEVISKFVNLLHKKD